MKNKLVSKNPILRFKEGKKILFAEKGVLTTALTPRSLERLGDYYRTYDANNPNKWGWYKNGQLNLKLEKEVLVGDFILKPDGSKITTGIRFINQNKDKASKTVKQKDGSYIYKIGDKWFRENGLEIQQNQFRSNTPKIQTTPDGKTIGINGVVTQARVNAIPSGLPKKTNIYIKGFENRRDEIENLGGISAVQNLLKEKGYNIGKYGADGKWGKDTEAAYQEYLKSQEQPETPVVEPTKPVTPISTEYTPVTFSFARNRENLNRSQTRDRMREAGYNPYDFTGGLRKALRLYLNGESDDTSKLGGIDLTKFEQKLWVPQGQDWKSNLLNTLSLSYRKKGGTLSSRNPITRFKENFRLVAQ